MSSNHVKKRKRQPTSHLANEEMKYPDIPGVPMDVIPLFIHAIRLGAKFFGQTLHRPYYGEDDSSNQQKNDTTGNKPNERSAVVHSLLERMEKATETVSEKERELEQRQERAQDAIQQWLQHLKRFAKSGPSQIETQNSNTESNANNPTADSASTPKRSVAYSSFLYLWDLQQEHDRIAVRRSALYMTGLLLQRSRDCRFHLEQDDHLLVWMKQALGVGTKQGHEQKALPLLQQEAYFWLTYLVGKGYAQLYPKLQVAARRLRQICPHVVSSHTSAVDGTESSLPMTRSPQQLRVWRDMALQYATKEIQHVQKLIERTYEALDILVPRMDRPAAATPIDTSQLVENRIQDDGHCGDNENGDDDLEEDIDWEDGNDDQGAELISGTDWEHVVAVERTLQAMESTRGVVGGELEIDLRKSSSPTDDQELTGASKKAREDATRQFRKCAMQLARTHIPRLSCWMEGLHHADSMVLQIDGVSWVAMSLAESSRREHLLADLTQLKSKVTSVLSTTKHIMEKDQLESLHPPEDGLPRKLNEDLTERDPHPRLDFAMHRQTKEKRNVHLDAAIHRQRKSKSRPTKRPQIKLR